MAVQDQLTARLELLRDFVNTLDVSAGRDDLGTAEKARGWFDNRGLPAPDAADISRLQDFREALRVVLLANTGHGASQTAFAALEPLIRSTRFAVQLADAGRLALVPADGGTSGALEALLAIVYDAMSDGAWARLKACAKDTCQDAFIDRSKNASGQWCSMAVCGNRVKAQRRRLRDRQNS
ncbi:MAG: CGNR zinc finger domain-containing protein [Vulcanimicrobiaceae bacterium]